MIDPLSLTSILLEPYFNKQKLSTATGFIIEKCGKYYLATNWHVVTGINPLTGQAMHSQGGLPNSVIKRQRETTSEMEAHVNADETCIITAKTVLDLAKRAKELFLSSKLGEKQQLLNFVFSNFQLEGKRLLVTLREPFLTLSTMPHQPVSLRV